MTPGQMKSWGKIKVSPGAFKEYSVPVDTKSKKMPSGEGAESKKASGMKW